MAGAGSSGGRVADAAALATAAEDIRTLVRWAPERILWAPGRAVWGLALFAGRSQTLISIDGCLAIAMTIWPTHYQPGTEYPYDAIARLLTAHLKMKRSGGSILFSVPLPHSVSGLCCFIGVQEDLQLLHDDVPLIPITAPASWRSAEWLDQMEPLRPIHPSLTLIGHRQACPTAEDFFALIGEAPDAMILPAEARVDQLRTWWRYHAHLERERLRLAEQEIPTWLGPDQVYDDLAVAWVKGWRGGPLAPPQPPAAVAAERPQAITFSARAGDAPSPPAADGAEDSSWM